MTEVSPTLVPEKSRLNGFSIPVYGLGTWHMGGGWEAGSAQDDAADIAAIKTAIERGVTHIDTAEIYAKGHAEELVGQAIKGYDREKLLITSKVSDTHLGYEEIQTACSKSLKRLNTEYLDLYLLHKYNPDTPLKDSMRALEKLRDEGLIRNIGVSNFGVAHLTEAQEYTRHPIVCDQVHYNLEYREPEHAGLLEYCQSNDIMLVAYRPVQKGAFAVSPPEILTKLSEKYSKTSTQIALNWLISQKNVVAIAKTRNIEHLDENLGALGWELEQEDIELLRSEYPGQKSVSPSVPLG